MCKKMRLSQQALADLMEIKRGKVAGYFYETQAKPDFYEKLGDKFDLDVGKFLTVEMDENNYDSFFETERNNAVKTKIGEKDYKKSDLINLLVQVKGIEDKTERSMLIDKIIILYGEVLNENSELQEEMLAMAKRLIK